MSNSKTETGVILRQHLAAAVTTQSAVSRDMGIARPYLNKVIGGDELPSPKWLDIVSTGLNLNDEQRRELHRAAARDHGFKIDLESPD